LHNENYLSYCFKDRVNSEIDYLGLQIGKVAKTKTINA